ncbi:MULTISPECIES: phosphate signaling complex protein PhoU [Actinoalloteichus]|uniref:Phosphate-specific transport system accessory protein PhoU n=1 Tax=Actinoalloteichus fjordicus TaxID=1612552 RepID=A0AAC9PUL3_9PSEU|nr:MULTISPECIES: phosphate signaling complex protein PhoU [Actinoalloteichus]APU17809.1 phosphate transport system regulatory protein PhoU [Actinoalloteichus fjordicus]APU23887.1 phosphate transport system regulatory protein PhoU [Actinoalloteichus sp. GBA129-24]
MREAYRDQLGQLADALAEMCGMATTAIELATQALLTADLTLAEQVIADDAKLDEARSQGEEHAFALLALQAPVAGDLRNVVAALHAAESLERMGDLALHVAKTARRRHPQAVLPDEVAPYFVEMGRVASELGKQAEQVIRTRSVSLARQLEDADDEMDDLHRHLFTVLMQKDWKHGLPAAVDITLLGRFYERFADHAVSVARRVVFVVTGEHPQQADSGS